MLNKKMFTFLSRWRSTIPQPIDYKSIALPIELHRLVFADIVRLELTLYRLTADCFTIKLNVLYCNINIMN